MNEKMENFSKYWSYKKEPEGNLEFKNTVTEFLKISLDLLNSKVEMMEDKLSKQEDV